MPKTKGGGPLQFSINSEPFEKGFLEAPIPTYFWLRDAVGRTMGLHRKVWLQKKGIKFGTKARGIRVPKVNEGSGGKKEVTYRALPRESRRKDAPIREIRGEAFAQSTALEALELGKTIRPKGRKLAIPLQDKGRGSRTSPRKFRKRMKRSSRLVVVRGKGGGLLLAERQRKRTGQRRRSEKTAKGKVRSTQRKTFRDTIVPRWVLADSVKLRPILNYYQTWDQQVQARNTIFAKAATRLLRDIANGIRT